MGTVTCTLLWATVVWWSLDPHYRYMYLQKLCFWGSTTANKLTKSWTTRISSPSKFVVMCCVLDFRGVGTSCGRLFDFFSTPTSCWLKKETAQIKEIDYCYFSFHICANILSIGSIMNWLNYCYTYIKAILYLQSYDIDTDQLPRWTEGSLCLSLDRHACIIGVYWKC